MSKPLPISVQLYSLREEMKDGRHPAILRQLADTGFVGVEAAGCYGLAPADFRHLVEGLGLRISGSHLGLPQADGIQREIDNLAALGTDLGVISTGPDEWKEVASIQRLADRIRPVHAAFARAGLTLAYHNHAWEMNRIEGRMGLEILAEAIPGLPFELDVFWASNHGAEQPPGIVRRFRDRIIALHLKDGRFGAEMMTACGQGDQDFAAIIAAADLDRTRWAVVELDRCATDMWQAVADSHRFLTAHGFCLGRAVAKAR